MSERRHAARRPETGRIYISQNGRCRLESLLNVSQSGVCVRGRSRLAPGSQVKVFLPVKQARGWQMYALQGCVVRRSQIRLGHFETAIELADEHGHSRTAYRLFADRAH
ncbi:MAG: PilZ domain-containing protein [Bradymonadia bacterium]